MESWRRVEILTKAEAANAVDPERPPCSETLNYWFDFVGGPRDSAGRRIHTHETCADIRKAREAARRARAA
jgi:hypothetical protein